MYNWRWNIMNRREHRDLCRANSREVSQRSLRVFLSALCGKIFLLLAFAIIITSCSRKRAPAKGCDCPGGGHGMIEQKNTSEPTAAIYPEDGSFPS